MTSIEGLAIASDWAAILTAAIAVVAYGRFVWAQKQRRKSLENYLREEKLRRHDEGRRSVVHLMANLAMTEAEILEAAFQSELVVAIPGVDESGRARRLLFEYDGDDVPLPSEL